MAAPTYVTSGANWGAATATLSLAAGAGSDLCVVALVSDGASSANIPTGCTWNGTAMTAGTQFTATSTGFKYRLYWLTAAASGTNNVVGSTDGIGANVTAAIYSGVSAVSGETDNTAAASTSPTWTVSSSTDSVVVALLNRVHVGGPSSTPSSPAVSRFSRLNGADWYDEDVWEEAGASSVTIDGTIESNNWFGVALSLAGSGGGGGGSIAAISNRYSRSRRA